MPLKAKTGGRGRGNAAAKKKAFAVKTAASAKKKAGAPTTKNAPSSDAAPPASAPKAAPRLRFDAVKVAKEVLRLSETGRHAEILKVLGDDPKDAVESRKAFLRISMLIHPDKLSGLPEATKAFQALVSAFDFTQMRAANISTEKVQRATLARSNDGCYRHDILCPRCECPWGKSVDGNPDYFYNFMMEGLKSFTCSTCLLKFGCLTAIHICPFCRGPFEYYPDQYHQKVLCGNPCCSRRFGFTLFQASERALTNAREQLRREFEAECRHREQKEARAARLARRLGNYDRQEHAEKCFSYGLRDTCPRCGKDLSDEKDETAQMRHLRTCTDKDAIQRHQAEENQKAAAKVKAEKKATAQHNAQAAAVFNFSGGGAQQLWLLPPEQLKRLCNKEKLPNTGSNEQLIERLAANYNKGKSRAEAIADLPKNLHSLSAKQLSAVCAAHGIKGASTREERLDALEELATGVHLDGPKAIKGAEGGKALAIQDKKRPAPTNTKTQASPKAAKKRKVGTR